MKDRIMKVIASKYGLVRKTRRRVSVQKLEEAVKGTFEYRSDYSGLTSFAEGVEQLWAEGYFIKLAKSQLYKTTYVDSVYWLPENVSTLAGWNEASMLRVLDSRLISLDYYRNHPEEQTELIWTYIERIYEFLRTAKDREHVTREERSLELFDQEKWLSESEGINFLSKLGLTLDSLKAEIVRELFEYYTPSQQLQRKSILISENHSFYHSSKRLLQQGKPVCGIQPDMLIYGEGWKIISSLFFLEELEDLEIDPSTVSIQYVGDMDKAGWNIYGALKLRYPNLQIKLAMPVYELMAENARRDYNYLNGQKDCLKEHLDIVLEEVAVSPKLLGCIHRLLKGNKRIPQEVLNYEVMARLA